MSLGGPSSWLSAPPPGSTRLAPPLSPFGVLLAALSGLVTPETREMLSVAATPSLAPPSPSSTSPSSTDPPPLRAAAALARPLSRALAPLVEEMRLGVPAETAEELLSEVVGSFDLSRFPSSDDDGNDDDMNGKSSFNGLSRPQWQVVVLVLLKAMSLERHPALRPAFERREGIARLSSCLRRLGCTLEAFGALLDVVVEAD